MRVAVDETLRARKPAQGREADEGRYETQRQAGGEVGDRRVGVVWHTQGSARA
ncbi:MAG: hypothetical protein U5R14_08450 [Gemmatimonadota bacterium]|nr:hypothetical protein [Gemmatimonadota bacterium]